MDKIRTLSELEEELTLKSSSEGILHDLIETQELLSSFEKLSSSKQHNNNRNRNSLSAMVEDTKRKNSDYNKNIIQRKLYKWNFEKSTNKELIDSILLSIFSGGEEGKKIALDYSKVLIEISYTQSKEETLLFLTRMEFSLSTTIKSLKDKIYDHKEITPIHKAYSDFFSIKDRKIITHFNSTGDSNKKSPSLIGTCTCNNHSNKNGTIIHFEINDEYLKTVSTLLSELINLFDVIMASSKEITLLFQSTFNLLYVEDDALKPFIASEILKEAFAYVIYKDDFIQKMFSIIKSQANNESLKEVIQRIEQFENRMEENCKEMKRLSCFIQEESMKLKGKRKQNDQIDLDDLVKYINDNQTNKNEKKEGKKSNKKSIAKKMKKQKQNSSIENNNSNEIENIINNNNSNRSYINQEEINELNDFKHYLRTTSRIKFSYHKIRPILSKEWINSISQGITNH